MIQTSSPYIHDVQPPAEGVILDIDTQVSTAEGVVLDIDTGEYCKGCRPRY